MTPDRNEPTNDEPENGVLADGGSLDTTGIGILGGATAQVDVALPPLASEDDDDAHDEAVDDGVVGEDFVPLGFAASTGIVEVVAAEDVTVDDETGEVPHLTGELAHGEEFAEEVADMPHDDEQPADAAVPAAHDQIAPAAPGAGDPVDEPTPASPAAPVTGTARTAPVTDPARTAPVTDPARTAPAVADLHPRATERGRTQGGELAPRRLDDFESGRETADLLTADRLLDPHHVVKPEPEGAWQHFVYTVTGRRINLGDNRRARERKSLDRRIAAPLSGNAKFVPVLSRKGGVGKTTITTLLGMALADARDDRVIAVDANPDRGTLAERIGRVSGKTVRDLVRRRGEISGYHDLSAIVARDETRLDVLASDADPHVSEAFSDEDYRDVAQLAAHYYSVVLTDTGTGIVHSVMGATLELADELVVVTGLSVDEARLASETLTWLESNGYADKAHNAVVVLNTSRPGAPLVRPEELEAHFKTRVRAVVRMPYDPHIATGSAISFRELQPETRQAARELAAMVVERLRSQASVA
ncbi:AAA family ATPase [Microbacterium sp. Sa4CUA7]|uniref:AAA family ATPase n=1 Tax=Microbacterium pullorum TaxID=2762236 RepID=A0ABR8S3L5_9MICO|nr:AAA family ATPase [Microbacterium pullorum]MBD7958063.1 AAA family ATPase [Microbacterium pullorum]